MSKFFEVNTDGKTVRKCTVGKAGATYPDNYRAEALVRGVLGINMGINRPRAHELTLAQREAAERMIRKGADDLLAAIGCEVFQGFVPGMIVVVDDELVGYVTRHDGDVVYLQTLTGNGRTGLTPVSIHKHDIKELPIDRNGILGLVLATAMHVNILLIREDVPFKQIEGDEDFIWELVQAVCVCQGRKPSRLLTALLELCTSEAIIKKVMLERNPVSEKSLVGSTRKSILDRVTDQALFCTMFEDATGDVEFRKEVAKRIVDPEIVNELLDSCSYKFWGAFIPRATDVGRILAVLVGTEWESVEAACLRRLKELGDINSILKVAKRKGDTSIRQAAWELLDEESLVEVALWSNGHWLNNGLLGYFKTVPVLYEVYCDSGLREATRREVVARLLDLADAITGDVPDGVIELIESMTTDSGLSLNQRGQAETAVERLRSL